MTHRGIGTASVVLVAILLACLTGCPPVPPVDGDASEFNAQLAGVYEVPPVSTSATGSAEVEIQEDEQSITYRLEAQNIQNVTAAHIHVGGPTQNGPINFFLFDAATDGQFTSPVTGTLTAADFIPAGGLNTFAEAIAAIRAGNTYVNVHTEQNPAGEIRGQLVEAN